MLDDEPIIRGLVADGWGEDIARRYLEERFPRRSRSGSGEGTSLPSPEGLNSSQEVRLIHAPSMERRNAESLIEKR